VFAAHIAYENDVFHYTLGTKPEIVHKPFFGDRGKPVAAYAVLIYRDGGADCEVIPWPEILEFKERFGKRPSSPWNDYLAEMAKKTAIRRIAKRAPLSVEIQKAAALDELAEAELPQDLGAELGLSRTDEVSARLAALATEGDEERAAIQEEGKPST
jgi:recombination protein RecT